MAKNDYVLYVNTKYFAYIPAHKSYKVQHELMVQSSQSKFCNAPLYKDQLNYIPNFNHENYES